MDYALIGQLMYICARIDTLNYYRHYSNILSTRIGFDSLILQLVMVNVSWHIVNRIK